jgi:ribonuclease E
VVGVLKAATPLTTVALPIVVDPSFRVTLPVGLAPVAAVTATVVAAPPAVAPAVAAPAIARTPEPEPAPAEVPRPAPPRPAVGNTGSLFFTADADTPSSVTRHLFEPATPVTPVATAPGKEEGHELPPAGNDETLEDGNDQSGERNA